MLECIALIEQIGGHRVEYSLGQQNRKGDHLCYISDLSKRRRHYPDWDIRVTLPQILARMIRAKEQELGRRAV